MNLETFFRFIIYGLAIWRLTHMIVHENGPFDVFYRIRSSIKNENLVKLVDCFECTSVWVAILIVCVPGTETISAILALSALAILIRGLYDMLR